MVKKFLLATDGTETSKPAEKYVLETLYPDDSSLIVLTVLEPIEESDLELVDDNIDLDSLNADRQNDAEAMLDQLANRYKSEGFTVGTEVRHGKPGEEICRSAKQHDVEAIFVGRRGHTKFGELFHGSVSHYVLLNAEQTVVITPSEKQDFETETNG